MTSLSALKRLVRATGHFVERPMRELIIELDASGITCRAKGTRRRYFLSWATLYVYAIGVTIARERAEKKKRRLEARRAAA